MTTIYQGKQDYCDIAVTDAAGIVIPYDHARGWEVKLFSRYRHREIAAFSGDLILPPVDENATFRIFISEDLTKRMQGYYGLQIKATYQGDPAVIDIAEIEEFLNVRKGY